MDEYGNAELPGLCLYAQASLKLWLEPKMVLDSLRFHLCEILQASDPESRLQELEAISE